MGDVPDWLQGGDDDGNNNNGNKGGPSTPQGTTSTSFEVPASPSSPFSMDDYDDGDTPRKGRSCRSRIGSGTLYLLSVILLGVFILSTVLQGNDDDDRLLWLLFYGLHAALTALFIVTRLCCSSNTWLDRTMLLSAVLMLAYTGFMLWRAVTDYQDVSDGDDRDDTIFEMGGTALGGVSILYHLLIWKCCSGGKQKNADDDNQEGDGDLDNLDV